MQNKFLKIDVVDLYLSITEELVIKLVKFAINFTRVPNEDTSLIKNGCK